MVRSWRHLVWSCIGAAALAGCAHSPPPKVLVEAREAYQQASSGTAAQERPQDVADAWEALLAAERAYDKSGDSAEARSLAYVALRKAQLAEVHASAEVAQRERALAQQSLREVQEAQRQRAQAELEAAQQQLAEARRLREEAERRASMSATEQQAAQLQAEARRQREEAERLQAEVQRREQESARQAELQRQQQEQQQRAEAEAEARRQAEAEAQRLAAQLETERQARAQEAQRLEAERQARVQAEQRAAQALGQLRGVQVREDPRGTVLTLSGSVLFASGQAELLPAARNRLEEVARALIQTPNVLVVEGHTDSRGTEQLNEELSRQRAEAVRDFLVSRGVPAERIEARGLGEYRPVASNTSAEGRANNRRVEIVIERSVASSGQRTGGTGGAGDSGAQPGDTGGGGVTAPQPDDSSGGVESPPSNDTGGGVTEPQPDDSSGGF
jgi:outer membrane protein OmpA-like peptidoglycan-associated protein